MLLWPRTCSRDLRPGRPYRLPNSPPVVCACAQAPLTHPGPPPPFPENVSFAVCACAREPTRLARTTAARGPAPALLAVVAAVCACARGIVAGLALCAVGGAAGEPRTMTKRTGLLGDPQHPRTWSPRSQPQDPEDVPSTSRRRADEVVAPRLANQAWCGDGRE